MKLQVIFITIFTIIIYSCGKDEKNSNLFTSPSVNDDSPNLEKKFDYKTTLQITKSLTIEDNVGKPLKRAVVHVYNENPSEGGKFIAKFFTDIDGIVELNLALPSYRETVYIEYTNKGVKYGEYIYVKEMSSLISTVEVMANCARGQIISSVMADEKIEHQFTSPLAEKIEYIGTFDEQGVPNYLSTPDIISQKLIETINNSLPERRPIPEYHPEYLADANNANLLLVKDAEVWITFVQEGAGYKNVLGYFTYQKDDPPSSIEEISKLTIVFPNVSAQGSGGGLQEGDKVYIGKFTANTVISYFLIAKGWRTYGGYNYDGIRTVFSLPDLNTESTWENRIHHIFLWDTTEKIAILGFEDLDRDSYSDNDFNDAVFYVTTSPTSAVDTSFLEVIDAPVDSDEDGVIDLYDDFPEDDSRAFKNYAPAKNSYGILVFEDLWPKKGDYDFNDVVIAYNVEYITNNLNMVVDINMSYELRAVGAGYENGFGIELPIANEKISSVTGLQIFNNFIELNSNNTESNQQNAVIIVSDNISSLMPSFTNVYDGVKYVDPVKLDIKITLSSPININEIGLPPYNPFLIINKERGREVHLPGYIPTDLVDTTYFGQGDDVTNVEQGVFYKTADNQPWGLNIPTEWNHMIERQKINDGYTKFQEWAESSGAKSMDWYVDQNSLILSKIYLNSGNFLESVLQSPR